MKVHIDIPAPTLATVTGTLEDLPMGTEWITTLLNLLRLNVRTFRNIQVNIGQAENLVKLELYKEDGSFLCNADIKFKFTTVNEKLNVQDFNLTLSPQPIFGTNMLIKGVRKQIESQINTRLADAQDDTLKIAQTEDAIEVVYAADPDVVLTAMLRTV